MDCSVLSSESIENQFWTISNIADLANIVIASLTLCLGYYVFVYQTRKDKKDKIEQATKEQIEKQSNLMLMEQSINLQWFKELIIQPHLQDVNNFYENLHTLNQRFVSNTLTDDQKIEIVSFIKEEQACLRKKFVDVLLKINPNLYNDILNNLDDLVDGITVSVYDEGFNYSHKPTFEREIGSKIIYSRNNLIATIFNFKGK
jgi:hypothetical protein